MNKRYGKTDPDMLPWSPPVGRDDRDTLPENSRENDFRTDTFEGIVVYGASWCPDARRARRFFDEHGVEYRRGSTLTRTSAARDFVKNINSGQIVIPVIVFPDESILVEPTNYDLAQKMEALMEETDSND